MFLANLKTSLTPKTQIMSWKTAFFTSIVALVASLFWGVNKPSSDCCKCDSTPFDSWEIKPDSAKVATDLFKKFRADIKVKKDKDEIEEKGDTVDVDVLIDQFKKLRGFQLRHCELAEMIQKEGPDAEVWAMLSVRPIPGVKGKKDKKKDWDLDLLFHVRKNTSNGEAIDVK